MNKKTYSLLSLTVSAAILSIAITAVSIENNKALVKAPTKGSSYHRVNVRLEDGSIYVKSPDGNLLRFYCSDYDEDRNELQPGATIENVSAVTGLSEIRFDFEEYTSDSYEIEWGWEYGAYVEWDVITTSSDYCYFEDDEPSYFRFTNTSSNPVEIRYVYVEYFCSETELPSCYDVRYELVDNDHYVVSGFGTGLKYARLFSRYRNKPVTAIAASAFSGCTTLTYVTIPSSITSIGDGAFNGCTGLTAVTLPNSITDIPYSAFRNCSKLKTVTLGNAVTSIGSYAFGSCSVLESINIPSTVTTINGNAFANCSKLNNITLPSGLTTLGEWVFYGCSSLTSINIPSNIHSLKYGLFQGCSKLASITIPSTVTSMETNVFRGCSSLTSVIIPSSLTTIPQYTFYGCTSLRTVTFPSSLTTIEDYAFQNCTSLVSMNISSTQLSTLGGSAFRDCTSLYKVVIPSTLKKITDYAFNGCYGLTSVTIGTGVKNIESQAFFGCSSLFEVINHSTLSISNNSSYGYVGAYSKRITTAYSSTYVSTSNSCVLYSESPNIFMTRYIGTGTSVTVPNNVTELYTYCFDGKDKITSITLPNTVSVIGYYAFRNCNSLTSLTFNGTMAQWSSVNFKSSRPASLTVVHCSDGDVAF